MGEAARSKSRIASDLKPRAIRGPKYPSRAAKQGRFKRGGYPIWACPSFSVFLLSFLGLSRFFLDFPNCSGNLQGFSRFVPFLFLGLLRAPTRNSPERVRDTIWTFPKKVGNPPVWWKPPGLASLNTLAI